VENLLTTHDDLLDAVAVIKLVKSSLLVYKYEYGHVSARSVNTYISIELLSFYLAIILYSFFVDRHSLSSASQILGKWNFGRYGYYTVRCSPTEERVVLVQHIGDHDILYLCIITCRSSRSIILTS
jgi:hypothetical protein